MFKSLIYRALPASAGSAEPLQPAFACSFCLFYVVVIGQKWALASVLVGFPLL